MAVAIDNLSSYMPPKGHELTKNMEQALVFPLLDHKDLRLGIKIGQKPDNEKEN